MSAAVLYARSPGLTDGKPFEFHRVTEASTVGSLSPGISCLILRQDPDSKVPVPFI